MTAIAGSIFQTTFAAISFAGAGFLFKMFGKNGYAEEMKRHNLALEKLAEAKELFYENEVREHEKIQELQRKVDEANEDMVATNKAFDALRKIRSITYEGRRFAREPHVGDFYKPSNEMQDYQQLVVGAICVGSGVLLSRVI